IGWVGLPRWRWRFALSEWPSAFSSDQASCRPLSAGHATPLVGEISEPVLSHYSTLGCADAVGHCRATLTHRLTRPGGGIACRLMLHFRVDLRPDQDHDRGNPEPGHKADDRAERAVGFVVVPEIRRVPREQSRRGEP